MSRMHRHYLVRTILVFLLITLLAVSFGCVTQPTALFEQEEEQEGEGLLDLGDEDADNDDVDDDDPDSDNDSESD